jgi:FAD/FMN-containing dehydrogenase
MELSGWGRYPRHESELITPRSAIELERCQVELTGFVARGSGRAYGDAAVGTNSTVGLRWLDRMRTFDAATATLTVEAGVLLSDVIAAFLPRGFFPPVVPGTKFVTVGGMIAADVHGKNHHAVGGFGNHVESFSLVLPSGEVVRCSREKRSDLFAATVGGMGLTGIIAEASFRLNPVETGWIRQHTVVAHDLDAAMSALSASEGATYSVAWIDCLARGAALGRSLVYLGEHATREELLADKPDAPILPNSPQEALAIPINLPDWVLNRGTVGGFNEIYFRRGAAKAGKPFLVPWDAYFFPLDRIAAWNRIYGRNGFLQHQCVIPTAAARDAIGTILERVSSRGDASFLAVLKKLGGSEGRLSFPLPGFTLALDFPMRSDLLPFLDDIDAVVTAAGGRIYLAKDARQSRATFEASYPSHAAFREFRHGINGELRINSRLSDRLGL